MIESRDEENNPRHLTKTISASDPTQHQEWFQQTTMLRVYTLDVIWWKWHFILVVLLPTIISPVYSGDKHQSNPSWGHSTQCLTTIPQNCQGHQNKESLRNCHRQEEPKEIEWLIKTRYFSWDLRTEKGH